MSADPNRGAPSRGTGPGQGGHRHDDDSVEELLVLWMKRRQERDRERDDDDGGGDGTGQGTGTCTGSGPGNWTGWPPGPTATPFLVVPSAEGDTGARPIPATQATTNASIQANLTQIVSGTDQWLMQLSCTVANLGAAVCAVGVAEFYVGDQFSIWNAGHASLTPAQVKANASLVGRAIFRAPAGGSVTVMCPNMWTPVVAADPTQAQKGILVQVYDALTDLLIAPFDALDDRHVGRNDELMDPIIF